MKITKQQLKQIIKEELEKVLLKESFEIKSEPTHFVIQGTEAGVTDRDAFAVHKKAFSEGGFRFIIKSQDIGEKEVKTEANAMAAASNLAREFFNEDTYTPWYLDPNASSDELAAFEELLSKGIEELVDNTGSEMFLRE